MSSLYSELFCHQPSLARTPTEDFLTQALADLLNRLQSASPEAHRCFVKVGCCRFQGHFVKVFNETGGVLWLREGDSAGNSSLRRSSW